MTDLQPAAIDTSPSTELTPASAPQNPTSYKPDAAPEPKPEAKPLSARQALEKASQEIEGKKPEAKPEPAKAEPAKTDVKVEADPKPAQPRENGKFASNTEQPKSSEPTAPEVKGAGQDGEDNTRSSEGRGHDTPPARFLPKAKEDWGNTPESVRQEIHRAIQNTEKGMEEYRESHEFRKELKQFEDMARQHGVTVKQALESYTNIDQQLRSDPAGALEKILRNIGLTPQQYAQHIMGQAQQAQQNPQSVQQQRLEQQVQQLTQQIQQLTQGTQQDRESARLAEVQRTVIDPFIANHPRYTELEQDIAFFLNSDRIPSTLNERQRLETAYDMAERINPAPHQASQARLNTAPAQKPLNPAGEKSIKGTPDPGADIPGNKGKLKTRDSIRAAAAELGIQL